mmetsp:Transcript_20618/g.44789  ORF Transcript_20618/g.44789 Transcript_20618/m.44789 type:complete len:175 (+) Transcript_20618:229-753(+)
MILVQQGARKALVEGAGLDTSNLDGHVDGVLSHKDLMWPHRAEIAKLLKKKKDDSGTISVEDLYDAKRFTADQYSMKEVSFGSYNEIPLIFLKCGGNADTGRVQLDSVLEFFDGKQPTNSGRISAVNMGKVQAMIPGTPGPSIFKSTRDIPGFVKFLIGSALAKFGIMQKVLQL